MPLPVDFVLGLLTLQIVTGLTLGPASGDPGWSRRRSVSIVRRSDDPSLFWGLIGCEGFLLGIAMLVKFVL